MIDLKEWLEFKLATAEEVIEVEVKIWLEQYNKVNELQPLISEFGKWKNNKTIFDVKDLPDIGFDFSDTPDNDLLTQFETWLDNKCLPYDCGVKIPNIEINTLYHKKNYNVQRDEIKTFKVEACCEYQGTLMCWGICNEGEIDQKIDWVCPLFLQDDCKIKQ